MGAQPVTARRASLIDTWHSPSRQILHAIPPSGPSRSKRVGRSSKMRGIVARANCGVKQKPYKILWEGCESCEFFTALSRNRETTVMHRLHCAAKNLLPAHDVGQDGRKGQATRFFPDGDTYDQHRSDN